MRVFKDSCLLFGFMNNYTLVLIDGSFLLTRALYAITRGKNISEVTPGDLMKVNLQTINRLGRDWGISGSKVMIIWDRWDEKYGGYIRHFLLRPHLKYKSSRVLFVSEDDLKGLSGEELRKAKREVDLNKLKQETKAAMIKEFPRLGIGCYYFPGYEFDDIATLTSFEYNGKTENPNIIVTKDTDLTYSLSPGCHFFKLPTYGSEPKIITYEEMLETIPDELRGRIGLYQYGAMINSAGFSGHNDLIVTKKRGANLVKTLSGILDGDYSGLKDPELYNLQFSSYNIPEFPDYQKVLRDIHGFLTTGQKGNLGEFRRVREEYKMDGIDDDYYISLISRFDEKYFSE